MDPTAQDGASLSHLERRGRAAVTISSLRGPPQARMDNHKRRRTSPPRIDEGRVVSPFGITDAGAVETRRCLVEGEGLGGRGRVADLSPGYTVIPPHSPRYLHASQAH